MKRAPPLGLGPRSDGIRRIGPEKGSKKKYELQQAWGGYGKPFEYIFEKGEWSPQPRVEEEEERV